MIQTGLKDLDEIIGKDNKGKYLVVASRPFVGKTALALNIAINMVVNNNQKCGYFSLDDSGFELVQRLLCQFANISLEKTKKGVLDSYEWVSLHYAKKKIESCNLKIDDTSKSIDEIVEKCIKLKCKFGLDVVIIDYIQLLLNNNDDIVKKQEKLALISNKLNILAESLGITIIVISQLSRNGALKRPRLSDLYDVANALFQDADIVTFVHRPDIFASEKQISSGMVQKNVAELIVAKNRYGKVAMAKVFWNDKNFGFMNMIGENK